MEKHPDDAYINMLKEELESTRSMAKMITEAFTVAKQCIIKWDWDQMFEFPEGRSRPVELHELVLFAVEQHYRIIAVAVTEYDDTGSALHAFIVALHPENGKLH